MDHPSSALGRVFRMLTVRLSGRTVAAVSLGALVLAAVAGVAFFAPRAPEAGVAGVAAARSPEPVSTARSLPAVAVSPGESIQGVEPLAADQSAYSVLANPQATPTPGVLRASTYQVKPGDTLISIADHFALRPETLIWANDLANADLIVVGQDLTIPPADGVLYTVQSGERLVDIVERFGVDLIAVSVANVVPNPDFVLAGEVMFLPGARPIAPSGITTLPAATPGLLEPGPEATVAIAAVFETLPLTAELQEVLEAGWVAPIEEIELFSGPGPDARHLGMIPVDASLERLGGLDGRRIEVRDPGDGTSRLGMTGWVEALSIVPTGAPSPRHLPRSYPENTRMDIPQVLAPYRTQLDGSAYAGANCGPASISMALAAYGVYISPGELRKEVQNTQRIWGNNVGSVITALARVVRDHGLEVEGLYDGEEIHRWTLDDITYHLSQKHPIVVQVKYRALPGREYVGYYGDHYILLTGVVDGAFLYNDPIDSDGLGWDRVMSAETLQDAMDRANERYHNAAFAVVPAP